MCCEEKQAKSLDQRWLDLGPTHMAPSFTHNPHNGDTYSAYNKPLAVIDFVEKANPEEDWLLIVDADMTLRLPYICQGEDNGQEDPALAMPCARGRPISAYFGYLVGVTNNLAVKHLPNVVPRTDSEGGQPKGRRADQVGGTLLVHREDIRQYMHDWLSITEDVRFDPDAWKLSGDVFTTKPGMKPWISEMYGYVFSAAKHDMWHTVDRTSMIYPGYVPAVVPRLMHYGLHFKVLDYEFDKHWHYDFDPFMCPPWGNNTDLHGTKGLFVQPPTVADIDAAAKGLSASEYGPMEYLRDLLAVDTVNTLNEALCWFHERHCPGVTAHADFKRECGRTRDTAEDLRLAFARVGAVPKGTAGSLCTDTMPTRRCEAWVKAGDCRANAGYMAGACPLSCGACRPTLSREQLNRPPQNRSSTSHAEHVPELNTPPDSAPDLDAQGDGAAALHHRADAAGGQDSSARVSPDPASSVLTAEEVKAALERRQTLRQEEDIRRQAGGRQPSDADGKQPGGSSGKQPHATGGEGRVPNSQGSVGKQPGDVRADAAPHIGDDGNVEVHVDTRVDAGDAQGDDLDSALQLPRSERSVAELRQECLKRQELRPSQVVECLHAAALRRRYLAPPDSEPELSTKSIRTAQHVVEERLAGQERGDEPALTATTWRWKSVYGAAAFGLVAWFLSVVAFMVLARTRKRAKKAARSV